MLQFPLRAFSSLLSHNYNFAYYIVWWWNWISHISGKIQTVDSTPNVSDDDVFRRDWYSEHFQSSQAKKKKKLSVKKCVPSLVFFFNWVTIELPGERFIHVLKLTRVKLSLSRSTWTRREVRSPKRTFLAWNDNVQNVITSIDCENRVCVSPSRKTVTMWSFKIYTPRQVLWRWSN